MKVLVTRKLPGDFDGKLQTYFRDVTVAEKGRPLDADELKGYLGRAQPDILVCTLTDRLDADTIQAASNLKCVVTFSAGVDHLDLDALKARGIRIAHTPDMLTDATADLAFSLLLASARRLKPAVRVMEEGRFSGFDPSLFLGLELRGAILGIVGFGRIGMAVAKRAAGFGMQVWHTPSKNQIDGMATKVSELPEILLKADVVSLHCPLTSKTKAMIGRKELGSMKKTAILVNTARGALIDEKALVSHLRSNPGFSAGLDVFENEPEMASGLVELPNAFCLPHLGSATVAARHQMADICAREAIRFAKGEPLQFECK